MSDGKIHIPGRKRSKTSSSEVIRISPTAYNCLVEIYNESTLSMSQIASLLITKSIDRIVYDKEEVEE